MINMFALFIPSMVFRFDLAEYHLTIGTKPQTYYYERRKEFYYFTPFELSSQVIGKLVVFKPIGKSNAIGVGISGFRSNCLWIADDTTYYDHLKSFLPLSICYIYQSRIRKNFLTLGNYCEFSCWSIRDRDNPSRYLDYGLNISFQLTGGPSEKLGIILEMKLGQITMFYDYKPPMDLTSWYLSFGLACGGYFNNMFDK